MMYETVQCFHMFIDAFLDKIYVNIMSQVIRAIHFICMPEKANVTPEIRNVEFAKR